MAEILVEGRTVHERGDPSKEIAITNFRIVDESGEKIFTVDYYQEEEGDFYSAYWPSETPPETFWRNVEQFSEELETELGVPADYGVYHDSGDRTPVQRPLSVEDLYKDPTVVGTPGFMRIYGSPSIGSFIIDRSGFVSDQPYLNILTSLNKPDQLCRFIQENSDGSIPKDLLREILAEVGRRSSTRLAELGDTATMLA